jgi:hypothetical protein
MKWSLVNFGKYKGKTLPQIMFLDPDWFFWAYENGAFKAHRLAEAIEIYKRARSIRVPQSGEEKKVVEYVIDKPTGKFGTIRLTTQPKGPSSIDTSQVIDMSFPRRISPHDKFGYQTFILVLKRILFGSSGYKMTKKRCEDFFDNDANFLL